MVIGKEESTLIAIIIKDLPYLKLLQPIILQLEKMGCNFILLCSNAPKGEKEYNRPTKERVQKSLGRSISNFVSFSDDNQLLQLLLKFKARKIISVEIGLWGGNLIKWFRQNNIKTFSISYLTDSIWRGPEMVNGIDRVYYTTKHLMNTYMRFSKTTFLPSRDRCLGSPIFDQLRNISKENNKLVLLPNISKEYVNQAFGSSTKFISLIESLGNNLVFKARQKQWIPKEIEKFASNIIMDGDIMYPSSIVSAFNQCNSVIMFYSSGIYESIAAKKPVLNVKLSTSIWRWDKNKLKEYFGGEVYNYKGVVQSVSVDDLIKNGGDNFTMDNNNREKWASKFLEIPPTDSFITIAKDILDA